MILCEGQSGIENNREVGQFGRENTRKFKVAHKTPVISSHFGINLENI